MSDRPCQDDEFCMKHLCFDKDHADREITEDVFDAIPDEESSP